MNSYHTPPYDGPTTPTHTTSESDTHDISPVTPKSLKEELPSPATPTQGLRIPFSCSQKEVDARSTIRRLQQDLLILTSFNDNSSLRWRRAWFEAEHFPGRVWTLHNPPRVVTEPLPNHTKGSQLYTRRMRRVSDSPPQYIKDWNRWVRYCNMYGVPHNFLCEEQIRLMRMGLCRAANGTLSMPPQYPLYPEPSNQGYILTPSVYCTHLPRKFSHVSLKGDESARRTSDDLSADACQDNYECVIVEPNGKLSIAVPGDCTSNTVISRSYRWSYLPWTIEMEESCQPLTLKIRLWNEARERKTDRPAV